MTLEDFANAVRQVFKTVPTMTLATVSEGLPWATDVYFAPHGWRLVFFSSPSSRHCRNLSVQPACSVTVHPSVASWRDIRGVQMEGTVQAAGSLGTGPETLPYLAKFPFVREMLASDGAVANRMAGVSAHLFTPSRVRYIDNAQGFGTRFLVTLADGVPTGLPKRDPGT